MSGPCSLAGRILGAEPAACAAVITPAIVQFTSRKLGQWILITSAHYRRDFWRVGFAAVDAFFVAESPYLLKPVGNRRFDLIAMRDAKDVGDLGLRCFIGARYPEAPSYSAQEYATSRKVFFGRRKK